MLGSLPEGVVCELFRHLGQFDLKNLLVTSSLCRDLVIQHCPRIQGTLDGQPTSYSLLARAATRRGQLAVKIAPRMNAAGHRDTWLAALCNTSLTSALAGKPWNAVTELCICRIPYYEVRGGLLVMEMPACYIMLCGACMATVPVACLTGLRTGALSSYAIHVNSYQRLGFTLCARTLRAGRLCTGPSLLALAAPGFPTASEAEAAERWH